MRAWVLLLCLAMWPAAAATLHLVTEEIPPSVMRVDGQITGFSTEKVVAMFQRAKVDYTINLYPWSRAYAMAEKLDDTCVFATVRIPEREASFRWVGPLASADWILYGRAGDHLNLKSLDDARKLRIGAYVGDVRGDYLRDKGFQVEYVPKDELNLSKLMYGRIDVWVSSKRFAEILLERKGLSDKVVPVLTFRHASVYLACNLHVPDTLVARLNAAMASLMADGTAAAIEARYASWHE